MATRLAVPRFFFFRTPLSKERSSSQIVSARQSTLAFFLRMRYGRCIERSAHSTRVRRSSRSLSH
eukprot:1078348-Karenia_brevis.AAC.1